MVQYKRDDYENETIFIIQFFFLIFIYLCLNIYIIYERNIDDKTENYCLDDIRCILMDEILNV